MVTLYSEFPPQFHIQPCLRTRHRAVVHLENEETRPHCVPLGKSRRTSPTRISTGDKDAISTENRVEWVSDEQQNTPQHAANIHTTCEVDFGSIHRQGAPTATALEFFATTIPNTAARSSTLPALVSATEMEGKQSHALVASGPESDSGTHTYSISGTSCGTWTPPGPEKPYNVTRSL